MLLYNVEIIFSWCLINFLIVASKINIGLIDEEVWRVPLEQNLQKQNIKNVEIASLARPNNQQSLVNKILQAQRLLLADVQGARSSRYDIIMGGYDFALAVAASELNLLYFNLDMNKSVFPDSTSSDSHESLFSMAIPDKYFAEATLSVVKRYEAKKVALILDETVDYRTFTEPFLQSEDIQVKLLSINSDHANKDELNAIIKTKLKYLVRREYEHIVVRTNRYALNLIMQMALYLAMVAKPTMWYFPSIICEDFGWRSYQNVPQQFCDIATNFTFISEFCEVNTMDSINPVNNVRHKLVQIALRSAISIKWTNDLRQARKLLTRRKITLEQLDKIDAPIFDDYGQRKDLRLNVHTLMESGVVSIGTWQSEASNNSFEYDHVAGHWYSTDNYRLHLHPPNQHNISLNDVTTRKSYTVVGVEEHPFLIQKFSIQNGTSFAGFGVDILNLLAERLNFTYTIYLSDEQGEKQPNGSWSGIIGELLSGRASMAIGPLVQMREREEVIDFTTAFKAREISLVMKQPTQSITVDSFFQFLSPFEKRLWLCIIIAIVVLSVSLFVIETKSARYWNSETEFDFKESIWFIFCTAIQGGTENVPRSVPGRILTGAFYFFILIVISSYTANLAAFLTVKKLDNPISDVRELANLKGKKIAFGTVRDSGVLEFFYHSKFDKDYGEIYRMMTSIHPDWLVSSSAEGLQRVRTGYKGMDYVFIWDDAVNNYEVYTEDFPSCNLTVVGRPFGKRNYAIGVPQNSVYKERLNTEILEMEAKNNLESLTNKWWKDNVKCAQISNPSDSQGNDLEIFEMAGVFLVLATGLIVAIIVSCLERVTSNFLIRRKQRRQNFVERTKNVIKSSVIITPDGNSLGNYTAAAQCNCHEVSGIPDGPTSTDTLL